MDDGKMHRSRRCMLSCLRTIPSFSTSIVDASTSYGV